MKLETIQATLELERTLLASLQEKITSPLLKQLCQSAWNYLNDCECLCFGTSADCVEQATMFLQAAIDERRSVEDYVSKWGYDAEGDPSKQR